MINLGLGKVEILLRDPNLEEIVINNSKEPVWVYHRKHAWLKTNLKILSEARIRHFAMTIGRHYLLSTFNFHLYSQLSKSKDSTIAAFAAKSLKEVAYHVRHSADWVLRLGDGTEESHGRMQNAIDDLWYFTADLFDADQVDDMLTKAGIAADLGLVEKSWRDGVAKTLNEAGLTSPGINTPMRNGSRKGNHTEHLGFILAEMQFLPRAYPDAKW
jgi:ring-1,2-phenylacetyl-CoA epoxidase subunit PaaC